MGFVNNDASWSLARAMHKLWADHVIWTASTDRRGGRYPDTEAAARLLKNQEDIGGADRPLLRQAAGERLTDLLKEHIVIACDLIDAARDGGRAEVPGDGHGVDPERRADRRVPQRGEPHLPKKDVVDLLGLHLTLTKQEAVARMQQDWAKDVDAFDQIFTEILTLADILSEGIVGQFPEKFAA